ncbi:serine protease easter-like [Lucilia cuprina]|uniref:serine protease easter-like n=1 Tax=Lucilia cuprina TaxID=7375 RepID=UPI001F06C9D8|nr:serine protease easter-like [Lucilia cuprina]
MNKVLSQNTTVSDSSSQNTTICTCWKGFKQSQIEIQIDQNNFSICCPNNYEIQYNTTISVQKSDNIYLLPNTQECGVIPENYENDIKVEFPWAALIEYTNGNNKTSHHCGATLINNRYVLTAAQCVVVDADWSISNIRLGEWDLSSNPDCIKTLTGKTKCADPYLNVGIEEIIIHSNYSAAKYRNDIALIRLDRYIKFTDYISPVCLPVQTKMRVRIFKNIIMQVVGWDNSKTNDEVNIKQVANLPGWSFSRCRRTYAAKRIYLRMEQMCAGGEKGVGICDGDSGGSLVVKDRLDNRNVYVLSGVTSFIQKPCGLDGWPGLFTKVGPYMDWILENIRS